MQNRIIKNTFETLERTAQQVAGDISEQITGEFKELPAEEKQKIENEEKIRLQKIRQNLIRQMEIKKTTPVLEKQSQKQEKQIKEIQKQKKKENALQRAINAAKGTKEKYSGNIQ